LYCADPCSDFMVARASVDVLYLIQKIWLKIAGQCEFEC
jgi:hypothetical protein